MTYLRILWKDATSVDAWTDESDLYLECNIIETVGMLIKETKEILSISLNHDHESGAKSCYMNIPKAWIMDRHELVPKKK